MSMFRATEVIHHWAVISKANQFTIAEWVYGKNPTQYSIKKIKNKTKAVTKEGLVD